MTIIPETKNWTWVLERRCDECGFDAKTLQREGIASTILAVATPWTAILRRPSVRERPKPSVWSPLEYACHVRDTFRIFDGRLARMLGEDNPTFANWDQDATAVEDRYEAQEPGAVDAALQGFAAQLAARYDSVGDSQWQRTGLRSDGSVFTVESFGRYLVHDPVHHLWDVGEPLPI